MVKKRYTFKNLEEILKRKEKISKSLLATLTPILGKPLIHTSATPFSDYVAIATEWATAHEDDRNKFL